MKIGMVGLGKMGGNMAARLRRRRARGRGLRPAQRRRPTWTRCPSWCETPRRAAGGVGDGAGGRPHRAGRRPTLGGLLAPGDVVIDGGNSNWHDSVRRGARAGRAGHRLHRRRHERRGVGPRRGLLPDGRRHRRARRRRPAAVRRAQAAGRRVRPRRPGRHRALHQDGPQRHRVRAHAGLRRGLRAAGRGPTSASTSTAALEAWQHGSVVRSWLLDLLVRALRADARPRGHRAATPPTRARAAGRCRRRSSWAWPRRSSRPRCSPGSCRSTTTSIAMKAIAALRNQFGGHAVLAESESPQGDQPVEPPSGGPSA